MDVVIAPQQLIGEMRPDEPRAARDEKAHAAHRTSKPARKTTDVGCGPRSPEGRMASISAMISETSSADAGPAEWKDHYAPGELLAVPCPGCGTAVSRPRAHEFGIEVAACVYCGLTYTRTPVPESQSHYEVSREAMESKYAEQFRGGAHPRDPNYAEHLRSIEAVATGRRLLDVGSHCGFFLRRARERGWTAIGVEPSPVSSALGRDHFGLDIRTGTLSSVDLEPESADVVTMVDVFEHVGEPRAMLSGIHEVLRPGGVLFIKVPNVRYVLAKQRMLGRVPGLLEDALDAREHLVHYSEPTLRAMVSSGGFAVKSIHVPAPIQSGGNVRRAVRAAGPGLVRIVPRGAATPLATDLACIALKR
jgi:2-polyprenyl-3-methyl-5-hydroxy-6-metoxy-1,4-benzoquinol methylase